MECGVRSRLRLLGEERTWSLLPQIQWTTKDQALIRPCTTSSRSTIRALWRVHSGILREWIVVPSPSTISDLSHMLTLFAQAESCMITLHPVNSSSVFTALAQCMMTIIFLLISNIARLRNNLTGVIRKRSKTSAGGVHDVALSYMQLQIELLLHPSRCCLSCDTLRL
jgi:hypothetical protein